MLCLKTGSTESSSTISQLSSLAKIPSCTNFLNFLDSLDPPPSPSYNVWCEHHLQETALLKLTNTNRHTKISIIIIIISNFES